ncbi:O-antigen ligase family protein [Anaerocolumna sp. AGMB13020]|uniref:O-antigen ligase family protein n=1 Tax=Anaerocolumna sp. AGMB13020 TaxID=3081750 RepID=UPI002955BE0C|nr:O-antigen ligase family protein [Anaerocolumna sp. AGMB13020]WOO38855.1 O-antigen ligase family protein [Anaerocolumna sp. AGMB13020]
MRIKVNSKTILMGFLFLYPIVPWYISIGPLNLVNIISFLFVLWWFFYSRKINIPSKSTNIGFWLYMIIYSAQAFYDTTILKAFAYFTAQLVVCIILCSEINRQRVFDQAMDALIYAGGFLCITGLFEEVTRFNIFHRISGLDNAYFYTEIRLGFYRIETSFSHPIVYCGYLCFIAGILLYQMTKAVQGSHKERLYKTVYLLVIINAVLTMSRSTLIVFVLEQVIILSMTGLVKFSKKALSGVLAGALLLALLSIFNFQAFEKIKNIWYMCIAVFDDRYSSLYTASFGLNESGMGNRIDLFNWVSDAIKGHELLGMGTSQEFSYSVNATNAIWGTSYSWTKSSIENEYLYNYYIHGLLGLISFCFCIIGSLLYVSKVYRMRRHFVRKESIGEKSLTFSGVMTVLLFGYAITLFFVRSSDNVRMFNVLMCLLFGYYSKLREARYREKLNGKENN